MPVYKSKEITNDGRCWYFRSRYMELDGTKRQFHSKKYLTKKEAVEAEATFLLKAKTEANVSNINFKQLIDIFVAYKNDKVKETTKYNYRNKMHYLEPLYPIKLKDFSIEIFERWKSYVNSNNLSTKYKNDIFKFLKSILNHARDYYDFNFNNVYRKMTNFKNPNELPKEMLAFSYEEFTKFLNFEDDLKFRCAFEILYYCGLRIGELKAITWKDIDFDGKKISINKQVISLYSRNNYQFAPPKTLKSKRILPLPEVLIYDLRRLKEEDRDIFIGFNDNYFVCSDNKPISSTTLTSRKNRNCELAEVKQIRIHDFRHSCATLLIHEGASINVVAKYLGHTKIEETLNTYSHLYTNDLDVMVSLINKL